MITIEFEYIQSLQKIIENEGVAGTAEVYKPLNEKGYF